MPISIKNYVDIISGVGGNSIVRQRELILRAFSTNPLIPTYSPAQKSGGFIEFTSADDVLEYFGSASVEYAIAAFYFGWISKNITSPQKISFARWANTSTAPQIYGDKEMDQPLPCYTSITNGSMYLTLGLNTDSGPDKILLSGINFSSAVSLAQVASLLQTKVRAAADGALWTGATVTFDNTRGTFNLSGGAPGAAIVAVAAGPTSDVAGQLGWLSPRTIFSAGVASQTLPECMADSASASSNFGSFYFIPDLSADEIESLAVWNDTQNVSYMFLYQGVTYSECASLFNDLKTYSGAGPTYSPVTGQYPELCPALILAATDYLARNSVQNYMFQLNFDGLDASVGDTPTAEQFDAIRTNYYGVTQTAGTLLQFYQRGVLMGGTTDPVDMNTYANEMWLKDAAAAQIMTLLLSLSVVSANTEGRAQILAVLQNVIDAALFNGTISVGKTLDQTQKLFITQQTGDDKAWYQVQNIGYWVDVVFVKIETTDSRSEYKAVYTLIYSKDDAVRKVEGHHELV